MLQKISKYKRYVYHNNIITEKQYNNNIIVTENNTFHNHRHGKQKP